MEAWQFRNHVVLTGGRVVDAATTVVLSGFIVDVHGIFKWSTMRGFKSLNGTVMGSICIEIGAVLWVVGIIIIFMGLSPARRAGG